ncbi:FAD-dependent oxidoreductase [Chloroflexota bacterium]
MTIGETRYPKYDIAVIGGGMAGITAAIASARNGAKTILIEKNGWLGGIGIVGATGLHSFFNIFDAHPGAKRMRVVGGIAQEIIDRVTQRGGGMGHIRMERGGDFVSMLTPVEPETFKAVTAEMCREAGARLLFHTVVDEIHATDGHVENLVIWNKAGRSLIQAQQYIDCTGDGDIAAYAGAPFESFDPDDPGAYTAGFTFRLVNVDLRALESDLESRGLISQLAHAVKPGMLQPDLVRLGIDMQKLKTQGVEDAPGYFLSSSVRPREITYCNCINYGPNNGLDPDALTNAEVYLRSRVLEIAGIFRENFAGCEDCYIAGPAPAAGQRRGRAIRALYELTQEDCTAGRQFDDQIGCFSFIDNPRDFVKDAGAYGIPFRALIPREVDNVLITGRMITVDLAAHNSTRNTVACMVQGQAAGTAAALAVKDNNIPTQVNVEQLQTILSNQKVLLKPVPDPL